MRKPEADSIMTNENLVTEATETAGPAQEPVADTQLHGEKKGVKVLSLEIDENDDLGGDPYNRTGSFCVPEFSDD